MLLLVALVGAQGRATTAVVAPHDTATLTFNRALGVECSHCHDAADWKSTINPRFAIAQKMRQMVADLNETPLAGTPGITCWSCHEGETRPRRLAIEAWQDVRDKAFVGTLAAVPEDVKLTMSVYSASLGVACDHCHTDDWKASSKPASRMVARMNDLFAEFPKYMPPSARTQCFMCHKGSAKPAR